MFKAFLCVLIAVISVDGYSQRIQKDWAKFDNEMKAMHNIIKTKNHPKYLEDLVDVVEDHGLIVSNKAISLVRYNDRFLGQKVIDANTKVDIEQAENELVLNLLLKHKNIAPLEHFHIESTYHMGKLTKIFYLIFKLGFGTLEDVIECKWKFSDKAYAFWAIQLVSGLEYLHSKGLVYRDMKPYNVLMDLDGTIMICDFGLTEFIGGKNMEMAEYGTPGYIAPEMRESKHMHRSYPIDWWALGATMNRLVGSKEDSDKNHQLHEHETSPPILHLLKGLLDDNTSNRLGQFNKLTVDTTGHPTAGPSSATPTTGVKRSATDEMKNLQISSKLVRHGIHSDIAASSTTKPQRQPSASPPPEDVAQEFNRSLDGFKIKKLSLFSENGWDHKKWEDFIAGKLNPKEFPIKIEVVSEGLKITNNETNETKVIELPGYFPYWEAHQTK